MTKKKLQVTPLSKKKHALILKLNCKLFFQGKSQPVL